MQDSARSSTAGRERASVQGSNVAATGRSRRRWSAEEKAQVVRESLKPGERVGEVARRLRGLALAVVDVAQPRPPGQARGGVIDRGGGCRTAAAAAGVRHA